MTKEELDIQKEIENYFTESTGFGRDKIKNFMDIVNKALKQKEERITDLEHRLEQTEKDLADYQFNYPKIKELEKENAELKETLRTYNGCGDWDNDFHTCRVYLQHEELQMYINQLTKAKDHIKKLLDCLKQDTNDPQTNYYVCQYMDKAEQFIKEIEK